MAVVALAADTLETMSLDRLEAEITELAGHLAAEWRWLQLIAEFHRRGGHEQWAARPVRTGSAGTAG